MKIVLASALAATVALFPASAYAIIACPTVSEQSSENHTMTEDDPNIPNCVMFPQEPYPGGVCERVLEWHNYGTGFGHYECPAKPS